MAEAGIDKLRIAIVSSGLGHVARGIETWAADTAAALHAMGRDVTLFKGSGRAEAPYERVCRCLRRGSNLNTRLNRMLPGWAWHLGLGNDYDIEQTTFALAAIPMLGRRFDVVHTQDPLASLILQRARKTGLVKAPTILAHGTEEPFDFLRKIDYVQHLAPFHLEEARAAGCYKDTWCAIGNFVDTERFSPGDGRALRERHGIPPDAFVVLSVAAVKKVHKRIDYLIREVAALRRTKDRDVRLVVAGARTSETDELLATARKELGEAALFLLDRPRESIPDILRMADVFALCSLKEMMPIALLEATATGLPCLVSTHPVVGWMVGDGGEPIPMEKEGTLAGALASCLDAERCSAKGAAARRHAVENFGKDAIVRQYIEMYERVIAHSRKRGAS